MVNTLCLEQSTHGNDPKGQKSHSAPHRKIESNAKRDSSGSVLSLKPFKRTLGVLFSFLKSTSSQGQLHFVTGSCSSVNTLWLERKAHTAAIKRVKSQIHPLNEKSRRRSKVKSGSSGSVLSLKPFKRTLGALFFLLEGNIVT
ncbi:hypothetical protein CDAR_287201 [Caerostris darwini]|uniref:Uncharacterized protein n=1 Tax=Caerostris darwini TaxID=1538125 RepID=A0AAV4UJ00_9ARAC|nr:hypothetical protein CDAR_287201 [Caerostris darwini]